MAMTTIFIGLQMRDDKNEFVRGSATSSFGAEETSTTYQLREKDSCADLSLLAVNKGVKLCATVVRGTCVAVRLCSVVRDGRGISGWVLVAMEFHAEEDEWCEVAPVWSDAVQCNGGVVLCCDLGSGA